MSLKNWSTTASSNATVDSINFAENQAPSTVNDSARALMADVRTWYEGAEWRDWGHTVTYATTTTFTISGDKTAIYVANRPIRCTDATTLYGKVASSSYGAPNTTVTVTLDSGSLSASLTAVALGQDPTGDPIDVSGVRGAVANSGNETIAGNKTFSGDTAHTGKVTMTSKPLWLAEGANVASASDCDIWAAGDGNTVHVTGTTTITDWGTAPQAGASMRVIFDGALTLTYNATTCDIEGGASITVAAGDSVEVYAVSTSAYQVRNISRNSVDEVSVASATTTDIGATASDNVYITGTTTITGLGTAGAGVVRKVRFADALTLTYNATSLIIPGSANITTATNDCAEFMSLGSGNWICTKYVPRSGRNLTGITTIASGSLSGTNVTVTGIPQNYSHIVVYVAGASSNNATGGTRCDLQLSTDNGSSYDTTAANYNGFNVNASATVAANTIASATLVTAGCGSTETATFSIQLSSYQAGPYSLITGYVTETGSSGKFNVHGTYLSASGVNALKLILNNGSFDAGTYAVYGIT